MNVITVAREYGAGGGEVARRLAERLGWELLDRELLHQAAAVEAVTDAELERLDEQALSLRDRWRLHPPHQHYLHGLREAVGRAVARGDVVLVGRGTRYLADDAPEALHLRLVAPLEWRAGRMAGREGWPLEQARERCRQTDRTRRRFMAYFFGEAEARPADYHLVVNTGRVPLDDVATIVAAVVREAGAGESPPASGPRVLTLSRELGSGEATFARTLSARLDLRLCDRELLEQEAARLGVSEEEMERVDEQAPKLWQRLRAGGLSQRYREVLGQLMHELAARGEVILVGRGGNGFLKDHPRAFHVRLVAPDDVRLRRVMEYRWLREGPARQLLARSDAQRRAFYADAFGGDWAGPLEYHWTVNTGRLGAAAVDLVANAAALHWARPP